jgi:hypothetical protein
MTAWYREINVNQEPFDIGLDKNGRSMYSFNIAVVKASSDEFLEEIIGLLVAAGVGVFGTDIFGGTNAKLPDPDVTDPILTVKATGGATPERTHNEIAPPAYQRPSAQIVARGVSQSAARTMARDAYNALVGIRNQTVVG